MCFYNSMSKRALALANRYGRKTNLLDALKEIIEEKRRNGELTDEIVEEDYRITAFTSPVCPIITDNEEIHAMQWGLIPSATKSVEEKERLDKENWFKNARADKIFNTWPYKLSIERRRCIIPSTGYFEYHYKEDGSNAPYFIHLKEQELFSMGGIWDSWKIPGTDEIMQSFVLITTDANELTAQIHNGGKNPFRMPLILRPEDESRWLDPELPDAEINNLLKTFGATGMDAYEISKDFRKKNPHAKSILEAV